MNISIIESKLEGILNKSINNKEIFEALVRIESENKTFSWSKAVGNLEEKHQYFIASTTKLYITATILKLRANGQLQLEDKISKFIPKDILSSLHVYKGTDYSNDITIVQLMSHTSGLPDYFSQKRGDKKSLYNQIISGNDRSWTFHEVINDVKKMKPKFIPGENRKAMYSDTNYQLLGKIIEIITHQKWNDSVKEFIIDPLCLKNTYVYKDKNDIIPVSLKFKTQPLHIPLAMISFGPDGGIVSTVEESMTFLRAFFEGEFFPKEYLQELYNWNKIFFPLEYGHGLMRFKLPRIFSPFKPFPELIGHSGLSGAFAYYCPQKNLYIAGTVNQIANPSLSYKLIIKLLNCINLE